MEHDGAERAQTLTDIATVLRRWEERRSVLEADGRQPARRRHSFLGPDTPWLAFTVRIIILLFIVSVATTLPFGGRSPFPVIFVGGFVTMELTHLVTARILASRPSSTTSKHPDR